MESRRPVMSTPMAVGAGLAFLVVVVVVAMVFDSPLSVFIIAALVLLAYLGMRYSSR